MKKRLFTLLLLIVATLLFAHPTNAQESTDYVLTGVVNDHQGVLKGQEVKIEQEVATAVSESNGKINRIFILLVPNIRGYTDPDKFGSRVFASNKLSRGDIVLWASFERMASLNDKRPLKITRSSELDGFFTSLAPDCKNGTVADYILDRVMTPYFQNSKFADGIIAGIKEIKKAVTTDPVNCKPQAAPVQTGQPSGIPSSSSSLDLATCLGILFLVVVLVAAVILVVAFLQWLGEVTSSTPEPMYPYAPRKRRRRRRGYDQGESWFPSPLPPTHTWPSNEESQGSGLGDALGSIAEAVAGALASTAESTTGGLGSTSESSDSGFSLGSFGGSSGGTGW